MAIQVTQLPDAERRPRSVAIGTFDGVHVGHRQVIRGADTVLTFEPHPVSVIHPEAAPKLIMPFAAKRDVIDGLGVGELVVIPFDDAFSKITAEEFIERILVEQLGAERVSVGENFRFGAKAKGDHRMLAARPEFETNVVPLVEVAGETVSSSRIRALVAAGDMEAAMRCLGAPFLLEGRSSTATVAAASWASRRPTSCPTTTSSRPGTASMRRSPTGTRPPSTSASGRCSRPAAGCWWSRT